MVFDRNLKDAFGNSSKNYQSSRREYPPELIDYIINKTNLTETSVILDIGCGTGKSTIPFAKIGCKIEAIDLSKEMIKEAIEATNKNLNISYNVCSFEDFKTDGKLFDAILSGTSFHWLEPIIRTKKILSVLKNKGHIAIFWSYPAYENSDFLQKLREIYKNDVPKYPEGYTKNEERFIPELKDYGLFENIRLKEFLVSETYTKEELINLLNSYSWITSLDSEAKENFFNKIKELLKEYDRPLVCPRYYKVITAQKISII